ncbi:hypothetical protein MTR_5g048080 [Medicago truncatula]|uniref:Uncharacterized protein n=1 Tax=Medicago truncatula TaxID=3880 RepID=G7JZ90_MEDTR|nr:hypothetical protein MTR_5g048080 [Medicago truncatula]
MSSSKCGGLLFVVLCDRLFNQRFGRQRCRSGGHGYSGHFNFIIYFCRHYVVIFYQLGCCEYVRRFILYVFSGVE